MLGKAPSDPASFISRMTLFRALFPGTADAITQAANMALTARQLQPIATAISLLLLRFPLPRSRESAKNEENEGPVR